MRDEIESGEEIGNVCYTCSRSRKLWRHTSLLRSTSEQMTTMTVSPFLKRRPIGSAPVIFWYVGGSVAVLLLIEVLDSVKISSNCDDIGICENCSSYVGEIVDIHGGGVRVDEHVSVKFRGR